MVSQAQVYEVQDDLEVKIRQTPLRFTKNRKKTLHIVTTQRSAGAQNTTQDGEESGETQKLQNGISHTVWTVVGEEWELRLILNPKEISSMLQKFNLIGFIDSLLVSEVISDTQLLDKQLLKKDTKRSTIKQICEMAEKCRGSSAAFTASFKKKLSSLLSKKWDAYASLCGSVTGNLGAYLCVTLVSVAAAVVSRGKEEEYENSDSEEEEEDEETSTTVEDGAEDRNITPENIKQQFKQLTQAFEIEEKLLCREGQKKVYVVCKDSLQEEWCKPWNTAVGNAEGRVSFHYGICHKILSVSGGDWEVQLLQSLHQNFDIYKTFNMSGFAESILMMKKWKTKLNLLLKNNEAKEEISKEVSLMASRFLCDIQDKREAFVHIFQSALLEKCKKYNPDCSNMSGLVGEALFGTLLVLSAALLAKIIVKGQRLAQDEKGGDAAKNGTGKERKSEDTDKDGENGTGKERNDVNTGDGSENGTGKERKSEDTDKDGGNCTGKERNDVNPGDGSENGTGKERNYVNTGKDGENGTGKERNYVNPGDGSENGTGKERNDVNTGKDGDNGTGKERKSEDTGKGDENGTGKGTKVGEAIDVCGNSSDEEGKYVDAIKYGGNDYDIEAKDGYIVTVVKKVPDKETQVGNTENVCGDDEVNGCTIYKNGNHAGIGNNDGKSLEKANHEETSQENMGRIGPETKHEIISGDQSDHDMPGCSRDSNFELGNSNSKNLFSTSLESTQGNGHLVVALLVLLIAVIFWYMSGRKD